MHLVRVNAEFSFVLFGFEARFVLILMPNALYQSSAVINLV